MIQKLQETTTPLCSAKLTEPIVLCAADENYVRPLAVMLQSAAQNLASGCLLKAIVLDGGISAQSWVGLKETLVDLPIEIFTIRPGLQEVTDLGISHHITHTAYLRLLAGRLLPGTIDRVIYLDSDLLVCDDLSELWNIPIDENYALAVPDIACPHVDARYADCNFKFSSPYFSAISPIRNWKQLGLEPSAHYFNSGVMVLNIRRMREEGIEERLLNCLRENEKFVWCWDQYALNVVFANQWKPLALRWNQGAHVFEYPDASYSPLTTTDFVSARDNPAIVHYTTEWKPWQFGNQHPRRELFFEHLDQTAFAGWRPSKTQFSLKRTWECLATAFVKRTTIGYRKITATWQHQVSTPADKLPAGVSRTQSAPSASMMQGVGESTDHPLLTIFAIPKAFTGNADIAQRNAINSWKRLEPFVKIVLLGDETGIANAANELNVRHLPEIAKNNQGTPLVSSAFAAVRKNSTTPYLAYCNCDVILLDDFELAIRRLIDCPELTSFLAIGQRIDVTLNRRIDFQSDSAITELKQLARNEGRLESIVCKDFFIFPRNLYSEIPDFIVGRGNWDNWMVHRAKALGVPVVSVSDCVLTIHQSHDYSHCQGRLRCYVNGEEARENQKLAAGRHLLSGSTSDFRLDQHMLRSSRMRFVRGEFWKDFPRFTRLLWDFVGLR